MYKKTKVPELLEIYRSRWYGRRWDSAAWRIAFGNSSRLPLDEGFHIMVNDTKTISVIIFLDPVGPKDVRKHRVFVKCPRCGNRIPAGRIHQHTC